GWDASKVEFLKQAERLRLHLEVDLEAAFRAINASNSDKVDPHDFSRVVRWHALPPSLSAVREAFDHASKRRPVTAQVAPTRSKMVTEARVALTRSKMATEARVHCASAAQHVVVAEKEKEEEKRNLTFAHVVVAEKEKEEENPGIPEGATHVVVAEKEKEDEKRKALEASAADAANRMRTQFGPPKLVVDYVRKRISEKLLYLEMDIFWHRTVSP
ncbi:hypothetical protein T484DRAFT_1762548, partial [Baffinella frigidus]